VLRAVRANGGVVMAVFVNRFPNLRNPDEATIYGVVDHVLRIAEVCGWEYVGIGNDFSGTPDVPRGLEDVSKFPQPGAVCDGEGWRDG
jgi:membrane dipeptidase